MSDRDHDDEPLSLEEARAARRLAEALEGTFEANSDADLRVAARIASTREAALSDASRDRIADELFGERPAVRRAGPARRRFVLALAASVAVVIGVGVLSRREASPEPSARDAASNLVAALLPAPTAAQRAELVAREARARLRGDAP